MFPTRILELTIKETRGGRGGRRRREEEEDGGRTKDEEGEGMRSKREP